MLEKSYRFPDRHVGILFLYSSFLLFGWLMLDGHIGIDLADEGYLWYGIGAMKAGMIPIRDFQAYDPGRYIWITLCSGLFGDGLYAMRASCMLFASIGVTCGLLVLRRISRSWRFLFLMGIPLALWMLPRYKAFEQSIALMGVYMAVRLIERPVMKQFFYSGVFIGLMAFMGRNHGVYMVFAFSLVLLLLCRGQWNLLLKRVFVSGAGIVTGYLPQLLMFAFVPGYFQAFHQMLARQIALGTNLGRPVPWPWLNGSNLHGIWYLSGFIQECFYVALPLFLIASLPVLLSCRAEKTASRSVLIAAVTITIPYAHFTFSRPDYVHLAHSVPTLLLVIVAFCCRLAPGRNIPVALALFLASFGGLFFSIGFGQKLFTPSGAFVEMKVRDDRFILSGKNVKALSLARMLTTELAKPEECVAFISHVPGLYPATNRLSPFKELYLIWPALPSEDEALINDFRQKQVEWLLLDDEMIDGRDDLYFHNTHPQTFACILKEFESLPNLSFETLTVYRRREKINVSQVKP